MGFQTATILIGRPNGARLSCAATIQCSQIQFFTT
jgi:hypothetical protein